MPIHHLSGGDDLSGSAAATVSTGSGVVDRGPTVAMAARVKTVARAGRPAAEPPPANADQTGAPPGRRSASAAGWLRQARRPAWLVAALFVVAVGVFASRVGRPVFWVDEYLTQVAIARPWSDLVHQIVTSDPGPGPYYLGMKIWSAVSSRARLDAAAVGVRGGGRRGAVRRAGPAVDRHDDRCPGGSRAAGPAERVPLRAGAPSVRVRPAVQRAGGHALAHLGDAGPVRRGAVSMVVGWFRGGRGRHGPGACLHAGLVARTGRCRRRRAGRRSPPAAAPDGDPGRAGDPGDLPAHLAQPRPPHRLAHRSAAVSGIAAVPGRADVAQRTRGLAGRPRPGGVRRRDASGASAPGPHSGCGVGAGAGDPAAGRQGHRGPARHPGALPGVRHAGRGLARRARAPAPGPPLYPGDHLPGRWPSP